jgi:mRNA interferase RelE/StbE
MYKITITQSALKELKQLQKPVVQKIEKLISGLAINPRPVGVKKLKGNNEHIYRVRSGDFRVVYAIEDSVRIVEIRKIGHRKDIYR